MNWYNKLKDYLWMRVAKRISEQNFVDQDVRLGSNVYLSGAQLSKGVSLSDGVRVYRSRIEGDVEIGRYTSIWGPNTIILSNINKIKIGGFCSIARNVSIQESNHRVDGFSTYHMYRNFLDKEVALDLSSKGVIDIGSDVWVGAGVVVLSGVKIGNGAIIGANSVVSRDIPPYAIAVGSPAKVIKYRVSQEVISRLEEMKWWEWDINLIKERLHELDAIASDTN